MQMGEVIPSYNDAGVSGKRSQNEPSRLACKSMMDRPIFTTITPCRKIRGNEKATRDERL